jgi:phosphodiesterase/alkaline phosphatase D-like protein
VWRVTSRPRFADDPFQLGVASGDPTSTGGVLWTRLAPRPFEHRGRCHTDAADAERRGNGNQLGEVGVVEMLGQRLRSPHGDEA